MRRMAVVLGLLAALGTPARIYFVWPLGVGATWEQTYRYVRPADKLEYDTSLGGYRTDITEEQLKGSPDFYRDAGYTWGDRTREQQIYDYWNSPPYWD